MSPYAVHYVPNDRPVGRKYYGSARWKTMKRRARERVGHKCERCGSPARLSVHHRTYERFGGDERPEDLMVLCQECHDHLHNTIGLEQQPKPQ